MSRPATESKASKVSKAARTAKAAAPSAGAAPSVLWQANPGRQARFLASRAKRALYGGAAGGGKSAALAACILRWIENPNYRGLYLRRESQYLGDAVDKTKRLYPQLGGTLVMGPRILWTFPSGATLWMNHCAHESDIANYDSFEFSEVLFDELTHFTEKQFVGICARLRGTDPTLPYWARAATNPGGVGHDWVKRRWGAWLDKKHESPAAEGEIRWVLRGKEVPAGTPRATSYTFVPALLDDNPKVDPNYVAELEELDAVRRAQLVEGDWDVSYGAGGMFHRAWWHYFDAAPPVRAKVRAWDLGAGGDATEGVLIGDRGEKGPDKLPIVPRFVVLDVVSHTGPPHEVHKLVKDTAETDGHDVVVRLPQDPGQAGKDQALTYVGELSGFTVVTKPVTGEKVKRAGPFSSQAGARNCALVRAQWNAAFVDQLHAFPDSSVDDKVDAGSDAFSELTLGRSFYGSKLKAAMAKMGGGERVEKTEKPAPKPPATPEKPPAPPAVPVDIIVELHSYAPDAVDATERTLGALWPGTTIARDSAGRAALTYDGHAVVRTTNGGYVKFAMVRQGYVKSVVR